MNAPVKTYERFVNGLRVKIRTSNDRPPVATRRFDWSAVTDDYEPGHPIGQAETEEAAIADLTRKMEER